MIVTIPKIESPYHICAMQKVSRVFSTKLQFGTFKQTSLKISFGEKEKNLWSKVSHRSLNVDL